MLIEVISSVASREFSYSRGTHDVPDEIAKMLLEAGHAVKAKGGKRGKSDKLDDGTSAPVTGSRATDGG